MDFIFSHTKPTELYWNQSKGYQLYSKLYVGTYVPFYILISPAV